MQMEWNSRCSPSGTGVNGVAFLVKSGAIGKRKDQSIFGGINLEISAGPNYFVGG